MKVLSIVADENIPDVAALFAPLGTVQLVNGRQLTSGQLKNADILLVRSVTRVDEALLAGSSVQFVATATIGTDHLDIAYLEANHIGWCSAPGSNADSVVDYVISAFCRLDGVWASLLAGATVGIIGMGNVGGRLYQRLAALGITCRCYDPLIPQDRYPVLTTLDQVLDSEILCCHAPLTKTGDYPTWHLLNKARLSALRPNSVLINAGRGGVIDNQALLEVLDEQQGRCVVLDVWENEPYINISLLKRIDLATAHIAGYSSDGKRAGAEMIFQACVRYFNLPDTGKNRSAERDLVVRINECFDVVRATHEAVLACYDIGEDDQRLRGALLHGDGQDQGDLFDQLRKNYPLRREFSHCQIANSAELDEKVLNALQALGFGV